jgi:hypothetical protein
MSTSREWKKEQRNKREDAAVHSMFWLTTAFVLLGFVATLLYGCGADPQAGSGQVQSSATTTTPLAAYK